MTDEPGAAVEIGGCTLLLGDCRDVLPTLEAGSVSTCITSPPYFGLRDYGVAGQIGVEPTPDEYVRDLVGVLRLVRDALADDGTLWLNIGDCYYNYRTGNKGGMPGQSFHDGKQNGKPDRTVGCPRRATKLAGIREKELIGIPWMVAFALRADGWRIRQEIVWSKTNPTPEKVTDRCTRSHEQVFLLTKSQDYFFDYRPIQEIGEDGELRRKRSVWTVNVESYREAHFATFPPALIEPCVKAGCPPGGLVLDPFAGAGTTLLVAERLQRRSVGIELNPAYLRMAAERIRRDAPVFSAPVGRTPPAFIAPPQPGLFEDAP